MASSTKTSPRKKKSGVKSRNSTGSGNLLTRLLFRPRFLLFLAVAISAAVFYPRLRQLLPDLSGRDEYRLEMANISVTPAPRWVDAAGDGHLAVVIRCLWLQPEGGSRAGAGIVAGSDPSAEADEIGLKLDSVRSAFGLPRVLSVADRTEGPA